MLADRTQRLAVARRLASQPQEVQKSLASRFEALGQPMPERSWALLWTHGEALANATPIQVSRGDTDCDLLVLQEDTKARQVELQRWDDYQPPLSLLCEDVFAVGLKALCGHGWRPETASGFDDNDSYLHHLPCRLLKPECDKATLQLPGAFKLKLCAVRDSWLRLRGRCRFLASNAVLRVMESTTFRSLRLSFRLQSEPMQFDAKTWLSRPLDLAALGAPNEWALVESDCDLLVRFGDKEGLLFLHAEDGHCEGELQRGFLELWSAVPIVPPLRYKIEEQPLRWCPWGSNEAFMRRWDWREQLKAMRVTVHDDQLCFTRPDETPAYAVGMYSPDPRELHYVVHDQFQRPMAQLRFVREEWTLYFTLVES